MKTKSYHAVWDGCPQLFYVLQFGRPDPQGREIAKYGYFRPFWPRTAFGTYRNPGRGLKMEKHNYPALGVPKSKKIYHAIRYGCPQLCYSLRFARPDPHGREIAKYEYFRPFWPRAALGTWRNPGMGPKTEKCKIPVLPLGGKYGRPKSFSAKGRNFFTLYILADRTPTGGKSQNTGV